MKNLGRRDVIELWRSREGLSYKTLFCARKSYDRNVMVNFKPSECMREIIIESVIQAAQKKKNPGARNGRLGLVALEYARFAR